MRNGYREKAIACAILHHLESYLFLWEQRRRTPLILMLYASVKVIMLVWKIMENTGFILDIFSIDKNTKTAVLKWEETRKKDTVHLGDCKKYNKLENQGYGNQQISFVRYHRQRGGSQLLAKYKTCFILMKTCQSYAPKVPFKTY